MKCDRVRTRLNAYADGELSGLRRWRIGRHVRGCPACRSFLASLGELNRMLGQLPLPALPAGLAERVVAAAKHRAPSTTRPSPIGRVAEWLTQGLTGMPVPLRIAACGTVLVASLLGSLVADRVAPGSPQEAALNAGQTLDGLEWFGVAPPLSVAGAYLTLAQASAGGGGQ